MAHRKNRRDDDERAADPRTPGVPETESWADTGPTMAFSTRPKLGGAEDLAHYLVVRLGTTPGCRAEVDERTLVIGRAKGCDFRLQDHAVSARHCSVTRVGADLLVEDLGSTNGTFVDDVRIAAPTLLGPDGILQVGSQVLFHERRSRIEVARTQELTEELDRARSYVEALLPPRLTRGEVRSDWCFVPSAVLGGDAFGHHHLEDGRLAVYLIDVCGHGTAAALHSVSVVNTLRHQTLAGVDFGDPVSVLTGLNDAYQMDEHDGMFFSAWYGVYATERRELEYAAAGHPPALLADPRNGALAHLATRGLGVGILPGTAYRSAAVAVPTGSALYVYSDGVFEFKTPDGGRWRHDAFVDLVARRAGDAAHEVARLREAVQQAAGTEVLPDDFSLMVLDFV